MGPLHWKETFYLSEIKLTLCIWAIFAFPALYWGEQNNCNYKNNEKF